uniref:Uncharacterized protein n=1 Tax=Anguilla anguilla TaxID=7936 RepID=A0A0E9VVQ7_ANGAN
MHFLLHLPKKLIGQRSLVQNCCRTTRVTTATKTKTWNKSLFFN